MGFLFGWMYNKLWTDAQEELDSLLEQELHVQTLHPEKDRVVFFQRLATLYVRYIQILRWLEEAYDQLVHPQKRRLVREVLDGVMGRIVELKNEMVEVEFSEYHYMNDVLQDLKLTPEDIKIPIPRYFISERSKELQERNMMLTDVLDRMEVTEKPRPAAARELLPEEAASIIQVAERARQGRLRANLMKEIRRDSNRQRRAKNQDPSSADIEAAAVDIQRVWRGYIQRKRVVQARDEELVFLGMTMEPRLKQQPCPAVIAAQANEARQRIKQEENESDYQRATVSITKQLRDLEAPEIRDSMKDQIQQWFIECRDNTGSFPDYPSEEDGGSALIFMEKTPQQLMEEITRKEEEEANKKLKEKEEKEKKNKGKAGEEEEEAGLNMRPSAFLSDLVAARKTFVDIWQNRSESRNFSQRHESELIKEEKRKEIEAEVRLQVDELMRQELANLKLTADRDKGGKAKVNIKKKKGSKNAEKKKDKDLTADRSLESLHQELVEEGLLRKADNVKMQDYLGDYSYLATTLRQNDIEPMPSLCDVRQVLTLYAILPLGSRVVHKKAPLIKAILLVGPAGIGKKMLVHAICQETGATLFDLSPVNTAGKYPGKGGLAMMLHMVFKVARLMQPSVIWIGDTEKMFYKKVPKEEKELDPQRLKRDLTKMLEMIKGEERVLVVGTTKDPLNADMKSLCDMYKKIILIPRPDYGSRYVIWKQLIRKNGGEVTSALDLSSLAKISDGYTQGHMVQVIGGVLTERRISQQAVRPLTAAEFAPLLAKIDPVLLYEEEALKNWYAKTPLGKKRVKAATGKEEEEAPVKGKGAKKKRKK
ncbi:dynein regulatory complex protein 11 isoform X2 [Lampris incognitus]|uniref:dynein regulatory complex protein 11 isoform X2 n=1 Tax=Lampris incognitus TaxID=2546036 RepID=UPI0024B5C503|nr:dynein regulatory complex protein 11 isoform X2 [Lampris incognitus]